MSWALGMGQCWCCRRPFTFNPRRVPSIDGEPICGRCIRAANKIRENEGRPLLEIAKDAYEPEEVL